MFVIVLLFIILVIYYYDYFGGIRPEEIYDEDWLYLGLLVPVGVLDGLAALSLCLWWPLPFGICSSNGSCMKLLLLLIMVLLSSLMMLSAAWFGLLFVLLCSFFLSVFAAY